MLLLTFARVGPAALHHQRLRQRVLAQDLLGLGHRQFGRAGRPAGQLCQRSFQGAKVTDQRMKPQRRSGEVIGLPAREQFDQVLQIQQAVVDGRGRQQKQLLAGQHLKQLAVTFGGLVAEVMGLIDEDGVGLVLHFFHQVCKFAAAQQVGLVVNDQVVAKARLNGARQIPIQFAFPHGLASGLWYDEGDVFAIAQQAFDQHHADKGLAQTDRIAQQRAMMTLRDFHQGVIALALILVEHRIHPRLGQLPLRSRQLVALEEFVQRLGIHLKRGALADVPLDHLQNVGRHILGGGPVALVPGLQVFDAGAQLHVQLHVIAQTGSGEVA